MIPRDIPREEILHIKRKSGKEACEDKQSSLKAVSRTAQILKCLQDGINTVTEIAAELGVHKSTSHRLLQALEEADLVVRNKLNRRYYIGSLISELASDPDVTHEYLVSCALNPMKRLAEITGESVGLNMLMGLHNVLLYEIPSRHELRLVAKRKISGDLHAGANARMLLAQLNARELGITLNNLDYRTLTERTITNKEELQAKINRIREQGWEISYGERIPEAMDIGVPIRNYFVPISLGILGPENRIKPRTQEFLAAAIEAGAQIEANISAALM